MPFRPNEITPEHVERAVAKIESENIPLIPSTRYDVFINNKPYPWLCALRDFGELGAQAEPERTALRQNLLTAG